MADKITCPRRMENGMHLADGPFRNAGPNLDKFENRHGMSGAPKLPLCSYCGCLDPEEFLRGLEAGDYVIGPTDKSYKIYVDDAHKTHGEVEGFQTYATIAKFYTMHFSEEQAVRFKALYDSGQLKFGYPGHFYRPLGIPLPRETP